MATPGDHSLIIWVDKITSATSGPPRPLWPFFQFITYNLQGQKANTLYSEQHVQGAANICHSNLDYETQGKYLYVPPDIFWYILDIAKCGSDEIWPYNNHRVLIS